MKNLIRITLSLSLTCGCLAAESPRWTGSAPIHDDLPSSPADMALRATDPRLGDFARNGEVIDCGWQSFLLGEHFPLGPAPHTPWARPLAGGPVRLTAITMLGFKWDLAEIERRLDCRIIHASAMTYPYAVPGYEEVNTNYFGPAALAALEKPADVIIVGPVTRALPAAVAAAIRAKVEAGCGLVLLAGARYGGGGQYGFWPLEGNMPAAWKGLALAKAATRPALVTAHHVTSPTGLFDGVPWEVLPPFYLGAVEPAAGAQVAATDGGKPLALTGTLGKGRIVVLPWGTLFGAFPLDESNTRPLVTDYQDYYAAAVIRAILEAAGRPSPVQVRLEPTALAAGQPTQLKINATGPANIELRVRDLADQTVFENRRAAATVALPALAAGQYLADLIARDNRGASLGWGSYVLNVTAPAKLTVTFDKPNQAYDPGTPVRITAKIADAPAGDLAARLRVVDSVGRVVFQAAAPVQDGRAEWVYPNRDPLTVLHTAAVVISRDGQPYLAAQPEFYAPRFTWDDFPNLLWGGYLPPYAIDRVMRRMREDLGIDFILCAGYGGGASEANRAIVATGARPFYTNVSPQEPQETERTPEKVRQQMLHDVGVVADQIKQTGAAAIFFQDERHGFADCGQTTPEALRVFREWLRQRYPDIAALNRAWNRQFASFDAVVPVLTKEFDPVKETSLAPWLEWRLWAVQEVVGIDRACAHLLRDRLAHPAYYGIEGVFGLEGHNIPYGGTDLADQSRDCFNTMIPYGEDLLNASRSLFPGPITGWNGYGSPYPVYERYVWAGALQGYWGCGWFNGSTFYMDYDWYYPQARWVRDLTQPLRDGLGKLLIADRPILSEPIAFLYSESSLYALDILGKKVDPTNEHLMTLPGWWARVSLQNMLHDAGVQFGYLSAQDLQEGKTRGTKLLVLTSCISLAPATCRALEKFVADGGIVLADLEPGVWDEHGTFHQPGQLDELFGVKRAGQFEIRAMPADWGVGVFANEPDLALQGQWFIGQYYEKTLQVAAGHALGKHIFGIKDEQAPAFVYQRHGKGVTLLTNYLETEYRRVPDAFQKVLIEAVLKLAKIKPQLVLRDRSSGGTVIDDGVIVSRWQDGPAEYYGVLLNKRCQLQVELPHAGHVYELVRHQYLGQGQTADVDFRDHTYAVIAVLPERVANLKLTGSRAKLGATLPLRLTLTPGGPGVKHVVHLTVLRPDGREYWGLSRNVVVKDGVWNGELPLALNDPTGSWRVQAREVVSGLTSETVVKVGK